MDNKITKEDLIKKLYLFKDKKILQDISINFEIDFHSYFLDNNKYFFEELDQIINITDQWSNDTVDQDFSNYIFNNTALLEFLSFIGKENKFDKILAAFEYIEYCDNINHYGSHITYPVRYIELNSMLKILNS